MIRLERVSKAYRTKNGLRRILTDMSVEFPRHKSVGILGKNGAGKSTLLRLLGGIEAPDSGRVLRLGNISWPLGFGGGFHGSLTGYENLRFACRIYGADIRKVSRFVERFSELGDYMRMPVNTYSSGMKARLAFGLSMAIDFECYLVDEITAVGDVSFQKKCRLLFRERRSRSILIMVSHNPGTIRQHCDIGAVLHQGKLHFYQNLKDAIKFYEKHC